MDERVTEQERAGIDEAPPPSASFEAFFDAEHEGLFGALYLLAGDRQDAEELMQEAFLRIWERWDRVSRMQRPSGYLYRTALNLFRMRRRRLLVAARRLWRPPERSDPSSPWCGATSSIGPWRCFRPDSGWSGLLSCHRAAAASKPSSSSALLGGQRKRASGRGQMRISASPQGPMSENRL